MILERKGKLTGLVGRHRLLLVILGAVALTCAAVVPLAVAKKKHHHLKKVSPNTGQWRGSPGKCKSLDPYQPPVECDLDFDVVQEGGKNEKTRVHKFVTNIFAAVEGECSDGSTGYNDGYVAGRSYFNGSLFQISKKGSFSGRGINESQTGSWISFTIQGKYGLYKNGPHSKKKRSSRFEGTFSATWYGDVKHKVTCHANHKWNATWLASSFRLGPTP